ncbi:MAG TPA: thiamine phosphate synthase [Vicinamibacterales bacterium]|nr:thiamine phosphate synthase [Vicinamibacterales bacterium]
MSLPTLYAIVDVDACARAGWAPRDLARACLAGGARLLQLRAKELGGAAFLELATALVDDARRVGGRVIVNDRADIAALSGAAGVHVGQDDLSVSDARRIVGGEAMVGLSTHTHAQLQDALTQPISYVAIGPVFSTGTKATGYDAVGLEMVRDACALMSPGGIPVVAIGGITLDRVTSVWDAGAASAAIIGDLLTDDPAARVVQFLEAVR